MPHMVATNIASATSAALNIVSATTANYTNIAPKWSRQKNVTRDLEPANSEASYFSAPEIISLTVTVVQIQVQFSKFLSLCLEVREGRFVEKDCVGKACHGGPQSLEYIYIGSLYS